jgi:hypothetical protein
LGIVLGIVAVDLALYSLAVDTYSQFTDPTVAGTNLFINGLVKLTFILLAGTCLVVAVFQLMRSSESAVSTWKPIVALMGLGFVCLMICFVLFRGALPPLGSPEDKLKGLESFAFIFKNHADIGTDAPAMIAIAKVLAILIAAVCVFISSRAEAARGSVGVSHRRGAVMVFSFGLTLIIVMGEKISVAGLGTFLATLSKIFEPGQFAAPVLASLLMLGLAVLFVVGLVLWKKRAPLALTLAIFATMPLQSYMAHWADNEQRGHLFGYWFGHDMFTPPFNGKDGQPIYPEMTRDAILYGGTDPGRFCPTYTIFCESFIPPECKPRSGV